MWIGLSREADDGAGVESALPRLEAVLAFTQEVNARLAAVGVDGIGGALEAYRRLREVLDGVSEAEVARMQQEVASLARAVTQLGESLEEIRRLKTLVPRA